MHLLALWSYFILELWEHIQNIDIALNNGICGSIRIFVPAVRSAHLNVGSLHHSFDFSDLGEELVACEVAAVECLGSDCDGIDLVWILGGICRNGCLVGVEGGVDIGPVLSTPLAHVA